jgi:hypothetical protein
MRTFTAKVPYAAIEAAKLRLFPHEIPGLRLLQFADRSALLLLRPDHHPDADQFIAHLVDAGMAEELDPSAAPRSSQKPNPDALASPRIMP